MINAFLDWAQNQQNGSCFLTRDLVMVLILFKSMDRIQRTTA